MTVVAARDSKQALSDHEAKRLEALEETIAAGQRSFVDVGLALVEIQNSGANGKALYRAEHATFEDYCEKRWGLNVRVAQQLMAANRVMGLLSDASNCSHSLPQNEAQTRPLTKLTAEDVPKVWAEVVETAPDGTVTAKHVAEVVARHVEPGAGSRGGDSFDIHKASDRLRAIVLKEAQRWPADSLPLLAIKLKTLADQFEPEGEDV